VVHIFTLTAITDRARGAASSMTNRHLADEESHSLLHHLCVTGDRGAGAEEADLSASPCVQSGGRTDRDAPRILSLGHCLSIVAVLCVCLSCQQAPRLTELPPSFSVLQPSEVPVILAGQVLENCHSVALPHASRWSGRPVQLWKVRVRVERVLQGNSPRGDVDIFYFVDWGVTESGWSRLLDMYAGHSEIFFLQKDGGDLRTICEDSRSCVLWVRTGAHTNYKRNANSSIEEVIVDLLLSRGDHTTDKQLIDAVYHPEGRWGWEYVIKKLQQLGNEESPLVRAAAVEELQKLQYAYGKSEPRR